MSEPEEAQPDDDVDEVRDDDALVEDEVRDDAGDSDGDSDGDDADEDGPVDQLGIPMSREVTLDDVRSDGEAHRRFAVGCSVAVMLLIAAFWVVRVAWLGAD